MFAVEKNMKVPQVWSTKQIVTYDWLRGFMSRNDYLSLRTPEPTSLGRSTAFNKHTADMTSSLFCVKYSNAKNLHRQAPIIAMKQVCKQRINLAKLFQKKGQKQVSKVTSAERGSTVTVCYATNAAGNFAPPSTIFPRQNI